MTKILKHGLKHINRDQAIKLLDNLIEGDLSLDCSVKELLISIAETNDQTSQNQQNQ